MGAQTWWGNGSLSCIKVRIGVLAVGSWYHCQVGSSQVENVTNWTGFIWRLHKMMKCVVFAKWLWFFPKMKWQYIQWLWTKDSSPMHIWSCSSIKLLSCRAYSTSPPGTSTCVRMLCAATRHNGFGGGDEVIQWRSWFLFHTCVLSWSLFVE